MFSFLEEFLSKYGHPLVSIGASGYGLERNHALELIRMLQENSIAVLGGDVYQLIDSQIEPTYDNWFIDKEDSTDDSLYIKNSLTKAKLFISTYKDPEDGTILYKLEIRGH